MRWCYQTKGVALITVMLILALATILAVAVTARQRVDIHRSANIFNFEQDYQYVVGAESWAKQILKRDFVNNKTDSLRDDWALEIPPLPIEGGQMKGTLEDLQARFNINNLVQNGKPQTLEIERFKHLLRILELDENLVAAIVDWIDPDEETGFSGAEDNEYLNLTPAYRAANRSMEDVSELLLIKGFNNENYEKLRPYVCVLKSVTAINVNTAPAEILASLTKDLSLENAQTLVEERNKNIYEKLEDFLKEPVLNGSKIKADGLSVSSQYFVLDSTVQIENNKVTYMTTLRRENEGNTLTLKRSRGVL